MSVETVLPALRQFIAEFRAWIEEVVRPPFGASRADLIAGWENDLVAAEELLEHKPELPIAMLGPSQQGKSTLINALLGAPVLAVGGAVGACTCVITSIHHSEREGFRAEIGFIRLEEWRGELRRLLANLDQLGRAGDADTGADQDELRDQIEAAEQKLRAVYGIDALDDFDWGVAERPDCGLHPDILPHMADGNAPLCIEENTAIGLRNAVRRYMVGRNQHADSQFWPLITEIRIRGNFPVLANGVVLVDLPGLDDPNPAREQVTRSYLRDARYLWLVCNSQTGIGGVFTTMLRDERLLQRLFLEGRLPAFSVVATRGDDLNVGAVLEQMGRDPDGDDVDLAEVVRFRKGRVRKEIKAQLAEIARGIIHRADDADPDGHFAAQVGEVPVFVVASAAHMYAIGLNPHFQGPRLAPADTGIPALAKHLQKITLEVSFRARVEAAHRRLDALRRDAESFFLTRVQDLEALDQQLAEYWGRLVHWTAESVRYRANEIELARARARGALGMRCEEFKRQMEQIDARAIRGLESVFAGWAQINWRTLKAAVDRDGEWFSRSLGRRFDFNADVASAFLDLIPVIWDEFFSGHLGRVVRDLSGDCIKETEVLVEALRAQLEIMGLGPAGLTEALAASLRTAQESHGLRVGEVEVALNDLIARTRQTLSTGMTDTVGQFMGGAYEIAKQDPGGKGIKARLLQALVAEATAHAPELFVTIRRDLDEGVVALRGSMESAFDKLAQYSLSVLAQVEANMRESGPAPAGEKEMYRRAMVALPRMPGGISSGGVT